MKRPHPERRVCLLTRIEGGHHQSYVDVIGGLLAEHDVAITVTDSPREAAAFPGPVLILLLEQYPLGAHLVVLARSLRRRRTAALVFRPLEALTGRKPQTRLKRALLRIERRLRSVTMLTILPHAILPKSPRLFRSWIHDPQLWDVPYLPAPAPDNGLAARAREGAKDRHILIAVGLMAEYKGMEMLAKLADDPDFCSRHYLVIAGPLVAGLESLLASVAGDCLIENRYISDGELFALYDVADQVWAVYSPSYDQASGIFGRAVQFGRTPVIRAGSLLDGYARHLGIDAVRVGWNAPPDAIAAALEGAPGRVAPLALGKEESVATLMDALFEHQEGDPRAKVSHRV